MSSKANSISVVQKGALKLRTWWVIATAIEGGAEHGLSGLVDKEILDVCVEQVAKAIMKRLERIVHFEDVD